MQTDKGDIETYLEKTLGEIERRSSPRVNFECEQRIAPRYQDRTPVKREFFDVKCRDLSTGGISFVLDWKPDFEYLVVALGHGVSPDYLTAKVVRITRSKDESGQIYIVGCRFTGRIHV